MTIRHKFHPRALAAIISLALGAGACSSADQSLIDTVPDSVPETLAIAEESTTTTAPAARETTSSSEAPGTSSTAAAAPAQSVPSTTPSTTPSTAPSTVAPSIPSSTQAPVPAPTNPPAPAPSSTELEQAEAESFRLLNELRASLALTPLTRKAEMNTFARNWSATMAAGSFEHSNGPYGENIAWNSNPALTPQQAAQAMHDMWVNSPGHYANMTDPSYTVAGVGFHKGPDGWHATHVFDR